MSDPEPYTTTEFNALRVDTRPNRIRATIEALERVTCERDEARERVTTMTDAWVKATAERDALRAENERLKVALRDCVFAMDSADYFRALALNPATRGLCEDALQRAREALRGVES